VGDKLTFWVGELADFWVGELADFWVGELADFFSVKVGDFRGVRQVMDNLNTHVPGSFYETFPPDKAKALWGQI